MIANDIIVLDSLPALAERINIVVAGAEHHASAAVEHALDAGRLLIEAKALVPHGAWEGWLADNCTVSPRTARAYMRLYSKLPALSDQNGSTAADYSVRAGLRAITIAEAPPRTAAAVPRTLDDHDRAVEIFTKTARSIREAVKQLSVYRIKPTTVTSLRKRVAALLNELDRLQEGGAA